MKTLYVSDLDGTLLGPDQRVSEFTARAINALVDKGLLFSYATARSIVTAAQVTVGLSTKFPVIVHNGTFIRRADTGELLAAHFFGDEFRPTLEDLIARGIYPITYSLTEGRETFRYWPERATPELMAFLATRKNDPRERVVHDAGALFEGQTYYMTCVDKKERLAPLYEKYKDRFHAIFYEELYSGDDFLEFMPKTASKSKAALELKKLLGCDKLVAFGDGLNDLDLFRAADEAYAVENAVPELKAIATGIIDSNDADGVAKWLLENGEFG